MILHDLKTWAGLALQHPLYLMLGGLALAVILFLLFQRAAGYFSEQNRILHKLSGHGVIYRFLMLEILTLVACLLAGDLYEFFTFHGHAPGSYGESRLARFTQWNVTRCFSWLSHLAGVAGKSPAEFAFERNGDWMVLHAAPAMLAVAAGTFIALEILDKATAKRTPAAAARPLEVMFGDVPFPWARWTGHLLISGTTRAGKSTALAGAIHVACLSQIPGLFLDNNGDFLSKFYRPQTDFILNPDDARSVGVSSFNEMRRPQDIEREAFNLVPPGLSEASRYFNGKSRSIFIAICEALWARGHLTNGDFWSTLKNEEALKKLLARTEWDAVIANAKSWGDIYSTAVYFFSIFNKLSPQAGLQKIALSPDGKRWERQRAGFSIHDTVEKMARGGNHRIFVPYQDQETVMAGPFLSQVTSVFMDAVMSLPPDQNRRIVCVVDELGELPEISKLQTALSKGGKYGLSVWLGIQNVSQLRQKYGVDGAKVLLGNCNSQLILRLPDPESSTWAADLIGKRYKTVTSTSTSSGEDHSSTGEQRRKELRHQLLPADIQHLPDLQGVLIYFGTRLIKRVNLRRQIFQEIHPRHVDLPASAWMENRKAVSPKAEAPTAPIKAQAPSTIFRPLAQESNKRPQPKAEAGEDEIDDGEKV